MYNTTSVFFHKMKQKIVIYKKLNFCALICIFDSLTVSGQDILFLPVCHFLPSV